MSEFVMSVNLVYISLIDSHSFIVNNSNLSTKTEILDSLTLLVPSCVTSRICQISCAVLQLDTLLNSFRSKAQNNAFMALALVCISFFIIIGPFIYWCSGWCVCRLYYLPDL